MSTWLKAVTPKQLNDNFGVYHGQWMPEMDRCWIRKEDGVCVSSRMIRTIWGNIEHVTITRKSDGFTFSNDGSKNFTWAEKQQIKDELFGENRVAIEVYPKANRLIDTADVYHLWVFDKKFEMPFGIHPKEYKPSINRGALSLTKEELEALQDYFNNEGNNEDVG